jgi:hypothetical protein
VTGQQKGQALQVGLCLQIKELLELDVERAMGVENVEWLRSGCAALSASS